VIDVVLLGCQHVPHARSYAGALTRSGAARLVGVYDESSDLGQSLADEFGVPYSPDADELLNRAGAAVVCSPTDGHRALVELAASRGVHVLCEKPLATSVADAEAMVTACREAAVQLHTAFVCRFYPSVLQAREMVARGELGRVRGMVGGNRGRPPVPPRYPSWITETGPAGGGALIDHSVHVIDAMRFVTGLEAHEVLAETATLFVDSEVEDSALVSVVFDGDVPASVDPSWSVTEESPWEYDFYLRLLGAKGSLTIATGRESLPISGKYGARTLTHVPFEPDIDQAMVEAFLQSVVAGHVLDPCANGEDGLRAVEVACAAYASVEQEQFVSAREVDRG
jgi:predicted dehydrogenase